MSKSPSSSNSLNMTRAEFTELNPARYGWLLRNNQALLDKYFPKAYQSHNPESIQANALLCETRAEFEKRFPGAYGAARKLGILDQVCSHMVVVYQSHAPESIHANALLCETRSEFSKRFKSAYRAALHLGILDQVCSHMVSGRAKKVA